VYVGKDAALRSSRLERGSPHESDAFLGLLQFSDGLFPAGSYAHSFGLESYVTEGTIRDAAGVESFLLSYLQGSVAPTDVVAALASRKRHCPVGE
jgi:urease accessory protein UreF